MSTAFSCAQCGATLRSEQGWCSLCYAKIDADFDPLTAPLEELEHRQSDIPGEADQSHVAGHALEAVDALDIEAISAEASSAGPDTTPLSVPAPRPALTPTPPVEAEAATGHQIDDVDVMLSMLAAEHRRNDPSAALADRMGDRSVRMLVMFGGMALVAAVTFLGLTALGLIF